MNTDVLWLFYAGIFAQAIFLLTGRFESKDFLKLGGCCLSALAALIPGKHETHYNLNFHLFLIACVFAVGYAWCFKKRILERINKEILMVWTLVGLYIALRTPLVASHPPVFLVLLMLGLLPVINAFAGFDARYGWKVYFYIWFLCVLVGIAASKFAFSTVANVFAFSHGTEEINALQMFVIGMSFLYLAVNLWYVIELIPLPGKHQSFGERLEEVEEAMEILAEDYDDEQVGWWKTGLLLSVTVSLLAANYFVNFVSDETLIPVLIIILPVADKIKLPGKTTPQTASQASADTLT
jgi:hypothetical protein